MFTTNEVQSVLLERRESEEPEAILAVLKAHDGKQLTKRLLAKLPGGEARWLIRQVASMTSLEDRAYLQSQGNGGLHFLVAYQLTNVRIDAAWIEQHNPAYFEGRRARNATRDEVARDLPALQGMADALNAYAAAKAQLDTAKRQLDALVEYGKPFSPDQYDWERLCGAREAKS